MNAFTAILYIIFAPVLGGLLSGFDRVITARMQGRKGPPVFQPYYDVFKLFTKQNAVVNRTQTFFVLLFLVFTIFTGMIFFSGGDILLVIFALTLAAIFLVISAYSTNSPYSAIGAERELAQIMSYEPIVFFTAVGFYIVNGSFSINDFLKAEMPTFLYMPGVFIGFVFILIIKFRKSPFDLSTSHHGHQEIVKGITTEFSGPALAFVEISHWYENILLLGFIYIFFAWNSKFSPIVAISACIIVFVFEIFIDNVFARVKWKLMLQMSWLLAATIVFMNLFLLTLIL